MIKTFEEFDIDPNTLKPISIIDIIDSSTGEVYTINKLLYDNLVSNNIVYTDDENIDVIMFEHYDIELIKGAKFLLDNNIIDFEINHNGEFDCYCDVDISNLGLTKIPVKFKEVWGFFDISNNNIKKLTNSPKVVYGDFEASNNNLENLFGGPDEIYGDFCIDHNYLKSFEGGPIRIDGVIYCEYNDFDSLDSFGGHPRIEYLPGNNKLDIKDIDRYFGNLVKSGHVKLSDVESKISSELYFKLKKDHI